MTGILAQIGAATGTDLLGVVPSSPDVMGPMQPDIMGLLSSGLSLGSAAFSMFGAQQQASATLANARGQSRALELSAQEDLLSAREAEIQGRQEANNIMDSMIRAIAAKRLESSNAGVDPDFGTPVSVVDSIRRQADLQLGVSRHDTIMRVFSRRRQALARRQEGAQIMESAFNTAIGQNVGGLAAAGGQLGQMITRRQRRGD